MSTSERRLPIKNQETRIKNLFSLRSELYIYNMKNENNINYNYLQHERQKQNTTTPRSQLSKGHLERQPGNHVLE